MGVLTLRSFILLAVGAVAGVWFGGWYFGHFGPIATYRIQVLGKSDLGLTYAELAAIMLGAVAVLVTVLGIGVAILAVWGYGQLNEQARKAATKHLKRELRDGALKSEVEQLIVTHVKAEIATPGSPPRKLLTDQVDLLILSDAEARSDAEEQAIDEESEYGDGKK